jgi:acyl carrier protein
MESSNIEGRRDHQIKLRGFRIELGEIEAQLRSHPSVNQAVVVAYDSERGEKQLAGLCVLWGSRTDKQRTTRASAAQAADSHDSIGVCVLETFSSHRERQNQSPGFASHPIELQLRTGVDFVAPRSASEKTLASIWADLLNIENVGVFDDFFALGGHSLLLVHVASRIQESFQVDLPLRSMFEAPTLAALAERIEAARTTERVADPASSCRFA